jgi:CheY-like chemotaxis protein
MEERTPLPCSRVLVVDDDGAVRELLAETYELEGLEVAAAASGLEALRKLEREPLPELVVLDLKMPGLDGIEVLRRMKSHPVWSRIPVAAISGAPRSEFDFIAEPDAFLTKPFEIDALSEAMRRLCERRDEPGERAGAEPPP